MLQCLAVPRTQSIIPTCERPHPPGCGRQVCDGEAGTVSVFDVEEEAPRGRPLQPLVSGAVPTAAAQVRGWALIRPARARTV